MGRRPCNGVSEGKLNRGPWTEEEDAILTAFINTHGEGTWRSVPKRAGLKRCRKSCRLRWMNYLRPDLKRGNFSPDEDELIIKLQSLLGNRWSLIAGRIPGRTDNDIKNYWNSRLKRKLHDLGVNRFTQSINLTTRLAYPTLDSSTQVKVEPYAKSPLISPEAKTHADTSFANCQAHGFDSFIDFSRLINPKYVTSSEVSSEGCDHHSVEEYSDPWTPGLDDSTSGLELRLLESVLFQSEQAGDDLSCSDYFTSFGGGFTNFDFVDTRETSFQRLAQCVQKNMATFSWPGSFNNSGDGCWAHTAGVDIN